MLWIPRILIEQHDHDVWRSQGSHVKSCQVKSRFSKRRSFYCDSLVIVGVDMLEPNPSFNDILVDHPVDQSMHQPMILVVPGIHSKPVGQDTEASDGCTTSTVSTAPSSPASSYHPGQVRSQLDFLRHWKPQRLGYIFGMKKVGTILGY